MGQAFYEAAEIIRRSKAAAVFVSELWIKAVGTSLASELCQIIELPLACLLDPLAGGYLAGHNSTGVLSGYHYIAGWLHGLDK